MQYEVKVVEDISLEFVPGSNYVEGSAPGCHVAYHQVFGGLGGMWEEGRGGGA